MMLYEGLEDTEYCLQMKEEGEKIKFRLLL